MVTLTLSQQLYKTKGMVWSQQCPELFLFKAEGFFLSPLKKPWQNSGCESEKNARNTHEQAQDKQ
jgi:hypothetical protein